MKPFLKMVLSLIPRIKKNPPPRFNGEGEYCVKNVKDADTNTTTGRRLKMVHCSASVCPGAGATLVFARVRRLERVILKLAPSHHNEKADKSN